MEGRRMAGRLAAEAAASVTANQPSPAPSLSQSIARNLGKEHAAARARLASGYIHNACMYVEAGMPLTQGARGLCVIIATVKLTVVPTCKGRCRTDCARSAVRRTMVLVRMCQVETWLQ